VEKLPKEPKSQTELRSIKCRNSGNNVVSILFSSIDKVENESLINRQLYINGRAKDKEIRILVDTGSQITLVNAKMVEENNLIKIRLDSPMNIQ